MDLQQQIEAIQREAFEAGYAAAMEAFRELASRSTPQPDGSAAASRRGRRGRSRGRATSRQVSGAAASSRTRSPRRRRSERGANARMIEEILQAAVPRALPTAEIRKSLQEKGVAFSYTSIRHALGQLEARKAARQVGNSRTWRHSANA
jgi:hypothetical protein